MFYSCRLRTTLFAVCIMGGGRCRLFALCRGISAQASVPNDPRLTPPNVPWVRSWASWRFLGLPLSSGGSQTPNASSPKRCSGASSLPRRPKQLLRLARKDTRRPSRRPRPNARRTRARLMTASADRKVPRIAGRPSVLSTGDAEEEEKSQSDGAKESV